MTVVKLCPVCSRTYHDQTFSFCLDDGSLLSASYSNVPPDDEPEPETVISSRGASPAPVTRYSSSESSRAAEIAEPCILITVNRLFKPGISPEMLYEITPGVWRISERRNLARYAFAVCKGVIREVYEIDSWHPAPNGDSAERKQWIDENNIDVAEVTRQRWQFDGHLADNMRLYIGQNTSRYQVRGAQNPIKYVNC